MNKWLGFSLTPRLRICDSDQEEEEEEPRHERNYVFTDQQKALMPLHSDGSLLSTDPRVYFVEFHVFSTHKLIDNLLANKKKLINNQRIGS